MNKIFFYILLIFSVIGCETKNVQNVSFEFSKSIEIPLAVDIDIGHRGNTKYINLNKKNILAAYSNIDQCIHLFDLDSLKEIKKIDLSNLPNQKDVRAFTFINPDTIFISTQLRNQYYFINTDGIVLKSFSILPKNFKEFGNVAYGNFNDGAHAVPIAHLKDRYLVVSQSYFTIDPLLNKYRDIFILEYKITDSIEISVKKTIKQMDLVSKKNSFIFSEASSNYCSVKNALLANFYHDKDFIKIDFEKFEALKIESEESNYYNEHQPFDSLRWDEAEYVTKYDYYSAGYGIIRYDPYNNLIYRVVILKSSDSLNYTTPYISVLSLKPFSIMIYDLNLKFLNEVKFPAKRYDAFNLVVTPKGILIGIENKHNPNFSTSKLQYDLFKIIKNE